MNFGLVCGKWWGCGFGFGVVGLGVLFVFLRESEVRFVFCC